MMKYLTAIVIFILLWIPSAAGQTNIGIIRVSSHRVDLNVSGRESQEIYRLNNFAITPNSIGNGVRICHHIGVANTPLPRGTRWCEGNYNIASSSITVMGVSRDFRNFQLSIVGGTGIYNGIGGTLTVLRLAGFPVKERLIFRLVK
jgi:hypothetical protein